MAKRNRPTSVCPLVNEQSTQDYNHTIPPAPGARFLLVVGLLNEHGHRGRRSSVNFREQDIFARKMSEKLTKCPNFALFLSEKLLKYSNFHDICPKI